MEMQSVLLIFLFILTVTSSSDKESKKKNKEDGSVEEEMHLRPLNERHHKFPNPALLDKGFESSKISRQAFLQQVRRKQNRRRGGKRQKRNKMEGASKKVTATQGNSGHLKHAQMELFPMMKTSYW